MPNARKVNIKNVQCINECDITIEDEAVNIKYGYNGLGKSSIGKGLFYQYSKEDKDISLVEPYWGGNPSITMTEGSPYSDCLLFDSVFINSFIFSSEALMDNSLVKLIENSDIQSKKEEIERQMNHLKLAASTYSLLRFVEVVGELESGIKFKKDTDIILGTSKVAKGLKNGADLVDSMPNDIKTEYGEYLSSDYSDKYNKWFKDGGTYILSDKHCPFCRTALTASFDHNCEELSDFMSGKDFANNVVAKSVLKRLADYAYEGDPVRALIGTTSALTNAQSSTIFSAIYPLSNEKEKLSKIADISFVSMNGKKQTPDEIKAALNDLLLDTKYFENITDEEHSDYPFLDDAKKVNDEIHKVITSITDFIKAVDDFNDVIYDSVKKSQDEINTFLKLAGIPYKFHVSLETGQSTAYITPVNHDGTKVPNISDHLSYGEYNSFSMALFGALAKREEDKNVLIILDDPISSFDENKKFAVMHFLFNKDNGVLKNKTVLMLTHDSSPVIDLIKSDLIKELNVNAFILNKNASGVITETKLDKSMIKKTVVFEKCKSQDTALPLALRLFHLRRYIELSGINNDAVYAMLSASEKLYHTIYIKGVKMTDEQKKNAEEFIKKIIFEKEPNKTFVYDDFIHKYKGDLCVLIDIYDNCVDAYEKVRITRLIMAQSCANVDNITRNYITETYHVSGTSVFCINGSKQVPPYIIAMCDSIVNEARKEI